MFFHSDRRRGRVGITLGMLFTLLLIPAAPARAERVQSDLVLIRSEDIVTENLYAAGNRVQIDGVVEGDLYAAAFEEVVVSGEVLGDVVAVAGRVTITGTVGGSARIAAGTVVLDGTVGEDLLVGSAEAVVREDASIGTDLLVWAWDLETRGSIGRNLEGQQHRVVLGGDVGGNVEVTVSELATAGVRVAGDLTYTAADRFEVDTAAIAGSVVHRSPLPPNIRIRAIRLLVRVLAAIGVLVLGLAVIWAGDERAGASAGRLRRRPLAAAAAGAAVVAMPFIVAGAVIGLLVVVPAEAGVPLLVVFVPLVVAMVSLVGIGALLAPVPVAVAIGRIRAPDRDPYLAFIVGYLVLAVVSVLPWVGGLLLGLALIIGLGGWLLGPRPEPDASSGAAG